VEPKVSAQMRVNRTATRSYEWTRESSHTLEGRDPDRPEALRADAIEATVQAIATASDPRLARTLVLA
jgi:hypothetical protein